MFSNSSWSGDGDDTPVDTPSGRGPLVGGDVSRDDGASDDGGSEEGASEEGASVGPGGVRTALLASRVTP
jgi:hypothetical protein